MKSEVFNIKGQKVSDIELPDFFNMEENAYLMKKVIVYCQQQSNRAGTAKTKGKSEVSGSGRKMRAQKRTGRARIGSKNAAHHRGGVTLFGPSAVYDNRCNKKEMQLVTKMILAKYLKSNKLVFIDNLIIDSYKTKETIEVIKSLKMENEKILILDKHFDEKVLLSSRNLFKFNTLLIKAINPLSLVGNNKIIMTLGALESLGARYAL